MQPKARESGYYWVKLSEYLGNHWEVAEYRNWVSDRPWFLTAYPEPFNDEELSAIGDRILRPDEQKGDLSQQEKAEREAEQLGPQQFTSHYWFTEDGVPDGGILNGPGFTISIQRGVVETAEDGRLVPNGIFTQTLVAIVIDVLENLYQKSKFANSHNEEAIAHFKAAQEALRRRLRDRRDRGVLNTHEP